MASDGKIRDSDSGNFPSDDEKKVTGVETGGFENLGHGELPPDPDAGMNDAERAAIVSIMLYMFRSHVLIDRAGQEASLEA